MTQPKTITVYVALPEEETPCMRGTDAIDLGNGTYKILATPYYNPEDEVWEFPPGTVVKAIHKNHHGKQILYATEHAGWSKRKKVKPNIRFAIEAAILMALVIAVPHILIVWLAGAGLALMFYGCKLCFLRLHHMLKQPHNAPVKVYIHLLEEGTPTLRPTQAVKMKNGIYKLLPTPNYDPEDEIWEFLPGSLVKCIHTQSYKGEPILLAVEAVK
jgi:hypothetical protein